MVVRIRRSTSLGLDVAQTDQLESNLPVDLSLARTEMRVSNGRRLKKVFNRLPCTTRLFVPLYDLFAEGPDLILHDLERQQSLVALPHKPFGMNILDHSVETAPHVVDRSGE